MKSNILLINPGIGEASQNKRINKLVNITFPTSIGFLAGYLKGFGIENIDLIDEQITKIDKIKLTEIIQSLALPRIIGISVLTLNCGRAYQLADEIKKIDSDATVVFGGIHPTVVPDEVLSYKAIDVVVRGEGEETLLELTMQILNNKSYEKTRGISYRHHGKIIHNAERPMISDLDKIPPFPYELFEKNLDRYPNFGGIFSSRGCPYNCTFCSSRSISGRKYRHNSVGRVIQELKTLILKYHQVSVHFMDDNIGVNKKYFKELCAAIKDEGLHTKAFFHGSLRGDNATDDLLKTAYDANFRILYYGLETGNERLMNVINKGESLAQIVDAINRSSKIGFSVGTTIIFGLPTETRKDRYEAIKLVKDLPLSSVRFNTLTPYPGTPVYQQEFPKGNILIKEDWENFGVQYMWESDDIPYVPKESDRIELIFDTMWANFSYYVSPMGIKRLLTQRVAGGNVIKLKEKWYLSLAELYKLFSAFLYLSMRFAIITIRIIIKKISKLFKDS